MKISKIPKNASYRVVDSLLEIYRQDGRLDGKAFRQPIYALGKTGLGTKGNSVTNADRDWLLENMHSVQDWVDYLDNKATRDFEWIDDDYDIEPADRTDYGQTIATMMDIINCVNTGGIKAEVASAAWRDLFNVKPKDIPMSKEYFRKYGGRVVTGEGNQRDHNPPMKYIRDALMPDIRDTHDLVAVEKNCSLTWLTAEENERVLTDWIPEDGSCRYAIAGVDLMETA